MNRRTVVTGLLTGGLAGVAASFAERRLSAAQGPRPTRDVVMDGERAFADAMAKRDLAAFSSHVSAEAVFFRSPDGTRVLRGKTAVVDGWKRFFEGPTAPFSWAPETAEVLDSEALAMTTGPVRDENGKVTGRFSSVWRLEPDGRWRVIFDRGCSCG